MNYSLLTIRGLILDSRSRIQYGFTLNGFTVNGTSFAGMTFVVAWISIFVTMTNKTNQIQIIPFTTFLIEMALMCQKKASPLSSPL